MRVDDALHARIKLVANGRNVAAWMRIAGISEETNLESLWIAGDKRNAVVIDSRDDLGSIFGAVPNAGAGTFAATQRGVRRAHLVIVVAILALGCESPRSETETPAPGAATCGVTSGTVLSGRGLGELRIDATVQEIRAACQVAKDSTTAQGNEGMPERRIAVVVATDTVAAIVNGDSIRRLEVTTPRFRTADSLGVGSTAAMLRAKNATLAVGDRGVFALVPAHCGLSFHLAGVNPAQDSWAEIPDATLVDRVLVFGC